MGATRRSGPSVWWSVTVLAVVLGVGLGIGGVVGAAMARPDTVPGAATVVVDEEQAVDCAAIVATFDDFLSLRHEAYTALATNPTVPRPLRPAQGGTAGAPGGESGAARVVGERRARTLRLVGATARLRDFTERHGTCLSEEHRLAVAALPVAPAGPGGRGGSSGSQSPQPSR